MLVTFSDVVRNGKPLDFQESFSTPLDFFTQVVVSGQASRAGGDIWLQLQVTAVAELACDRCLAPVSHPLSAETRSRLRYLPGTSGLHLIDEEGADLYLFGDAPTDLTPLVREPLYLSLPDQTLCRPDCQGLCPHCGSNRNTQRCPHRASSPSDPRLAALADLNL